MQGTTIHDWLRPRLAALVQEGRAKGFDPEAVIATMIDLADSEDFSAPPAAAAPAPE